MDEATEAEHLRLLVEAGLGRGMNVVDFGCGPGTLSRLMARTVGPAGRILGLDLSAFNVARARELAAQEKIGNISFEVGNPLDTRLASGFADVCVAGYLLGNISHPEQVVKEMVRVVRPGGMVAAFDGDEGLVVYEPEPPALAELRDLLVRERLASGGNRMIGRSLYRLLAEAGLTGVRVVVLTSTSTDPEWSPTRDPRGHAAHLTQALRRLVEEDRLPREEASRYFRVLEEVAKNPLSFVCISSFFAYGRRPLRCA